MGARERYDSISLGVWLWRVERGWKHDCLHLNWCRPLLLWNKSEREKNWVRQIARESSVEGKQKTNKGAEGDTEEISTNQSCHCFFLSQSQEQISLRCWTKISDSISQILCKSASKHSANQAACKSVWGCNTTRITFFFNVMSAKCSLSIFSIGYLYI